MRINSASPISFGKINVTLDGEQKELLYKHAAFGIGEGSVGAFKEKCRLANLSKRYDINVNENGADVFDKELNQKTSFNTDEYPEYKEYPNVLYHMLNAATNFVLAKEGRIFEP